MLIELQKLDKLINSLQTKLISFPPGKLTCTKNGNYHKWYRNDGNHRIYIPKKNRDLAEQLALKKYLSVLLKEANQEKKAIHAYLKYQPTFPKESEKMLSDTSGYKPLLSAYFQPLSQELSQWMTEPYEHNPNHPEHLIFKSSSGNLVRSKSESLIDLLLHINKIPFRYECVLKLGATTIYPDFTIRHPQTGELFYWEHFGMMDDPPYCRKMCAKLQLYTTHGIIPSIHLITTYETQSNPLTSDMIEKIIHDYFLL